MYRQITFACLLVACLTLCTGCKTVGDTRYRFIFGFGWVKSKAEITDTKALGVTVTYPPGLTAGYLHQRDISLPTGTNLILEIK